MSLQCALDLVPAWKELTEPFELHEVMIALAIKMMSKAQLGAFFKDDKGVHELHVIYGKVSRVKRVGKINCLISPVFSDHDCLRCSLDWRVLSAGRGISDQVERLSRVGSTRGIRSSSGKVTKLVGKQSVH